MPWWLTEQGPRRLFPKKGARTMPSIDMGQDQHVGPHQMELRDGIWWCATEDVVSEQCSDYDRCNATCYCNDKEGT